ncbi:Kinesin KIF27 [Brachionus plicatilis]|uniref:Kinesin KIF27 n=1 Tax=Brachionus plicatilis TaxID=10195 RepID=A0A3M7RDU1_BRAPC|nr:Kinesin KIF27 [Brachionus plicatilis]
MDILIKTLYLSLVGLSKNRSDFDVDDFTKQKISQLEQLLKQAQDDLKSDEEIFADKENEINSLKELASDLDQKLQFSNRCLEQSLNKEREQQDLLLQLQLQLDNLIAHKRDSDSPNTSGYKSLSGSSKSLNKLVNQRAKTAPVEETPKKLNVRPGAYSTPSISNNNLDTFMQNFRARSQLLTETLEENDCVLQNANLNGKFNSTFSVNDEQLDQPENEENQENESDFKFMRKGTFKVNKNKQIVSKENNKIRDMSINIKEKAIT